MGLSWGHRATVGGQMGSLGLSRRIPRMAARGGGGRGIGVVEILGETVKGRQGRVEMGATEC